MNSLARGVPMVPRLRLVVLTPSMTYWFSNDVDPENATPRLSPAEPAA